MLTLIYQPQGYTNVLKIDLSMDAESMNRELMDGNSNSNDSNSKEESWVN
jgi:hypothetical protein